MDFPTPDFILQAINQRLQHPMIGYTFGDTDYFTALTTWLKKRYHITARAKELHFIPGIVAGISFFVQAFTTITIASAEKSALTDKYDWERMRDISAVLSQKNIRTIGEYFDGSREGLDAAGNPAAYDIITAVNQGVDLVLYAGHGDYSGWNTGMLTQNQLQHLNNTRYPIVIAAACNNGHFAGRTCMAETWLNSEYGAKAAIMSSALCDWDANLEALVYICNKLPAQSKQRTQATLH